MRSTCNSGSNGSGSVMCVYMIIVQTVLSSPVIRSRSEQNNLTILDSTSELLDSTRSTTHHHWSTPSSSFIARTKRHEVEDKIITEILPTRHAKHRRRRRCKNRPTCLRFATSAPSLNVGSIDHSKTQQRDTDYENEDNVGSHLPLENGSTEESNVSTSIRLNNKDITNLTNVDHISTYDNEYVESKDDEDDDDTTIGDYVDSTDISSSIYVPPDDDDQTVVHDSFVNLLTRLFQNLRNVSAEDSEEILKELNFVDNANEDPCQKWLNSKDKLEKAFLGPLTILPACPCQYPSNIFYDDKIWDEEQGKYFRWRDVSGKSQRLDVYKPGAAYCVRSLLAQGSGSAAAQQCCYDRQRKLITRGSGAGTPNFVSPEISVVLHERIDVLPWRLCKGDFSRYNKVRPPNNDNGCDDNPDDEEYQRQINNTKYY